MTDGEIEQTALAERNVSMSNRLARAAQGLNLAEKRLIALGLAKTDSYSLKRVPLATNQGWRLRLSAQEYAEEFGVTASTAYQQLKEASEHLYERTIGFVVQGRKGEKLRKWRWVSAVEYADGEGYVELNFSPDVAPHLLGLRKQFTTYKLKQAAAFDTIYAWRLFECLQSWSDTGRWTPSIEEFWEVMEAPPSCRSDFKALRVRVIEPSVLSINAKAGMKLGWRPVRHGGRRVSGLDFTFVKDTQEDLFGHPPPESD
jgi:plasmid replication initiation protein